MSMQDPIANALTIIRNAILVKKENVLIPHSKFIEHMIEIMLQEKYIHSYKKEQIKNFMFLNVKLLYLNNKSVINNLKRVSKPSVRVYTDSKNLPQVLNNFGIAIISTSKGIMTNKEAKRENIGGEVIAMVW